MLREVLLFFGLLYLIRADQVCSQFGYNMGAEIRCLRSVLAECERTAAKSAGPHVSPRSTHSHGGGNRLHSVTTYQQEPASQPLATFTRPMWVDSAEPTTTPARPTIPAIDTKALEENLSKNFSARVTELEARLQAAVRAVEEKARMQIEEVTRRTDAEIRRLSKKVKFLTARVHRYNDHEYALMEESQSWYAAEETCQAWGGHLASIADAHENDFIKGIHEGNVWIGLNDVQLENVHLYTDGKTYPYRNWRAGEPDNYQHNENCVLQEKDGFWSDMLCIVTRPAICKR